MAASNSVTVDTCFIYLNSAFPVYIHQPVLTNIIRSYGKAPHTECNRPDWPIVMDRHVRSGVTHLSMDSNELLGVTFRPRRQLHISQSSTILHTTYRDTDITVVTYSSLGHITSHHSVLLFKEIN